MPYELLPNAEHCLRRTLLMRFAVSALLLSCLGIYGTLNYITRLQRREVGLRLAPRAPRGGILRHFVGQGLRVAVLASLLGVEDIDVGSVQSARCTDIH